MLLPLAFALSFLLPSTAMIAEAPQQSAAKPFVAPFTPMAEPPKLPKVDLNSCPFEGCQFGKWTARAKVVVYSTWESTRKPVATVAKGDEVTALTGVNLVLEAGKGVFDRDVPTYGALKGDTAYMYQNCGEGELDMWVHGRFIKCADLNFSGPGLEGCHKNCDGRWLSVPKSEWWAQLRLKEGPSGWVRVDGNFEGTDALAGKLTGTFPCGHASRIPGPWMSSGRHGPGSCQRSALSQQHDGDASDSGHAGR